MVFVQLLFTAESCHFCNLISYWYSLEKSLDFGASRSYHRHSKILIKSDCNLI